MSGSAVAKVTGAEERFRLLLEAAPEAIVVTKRDGRIIRVNTQTERLFGYPREELLGQNVEVLLPQRVRHRHVKKPPRTSVIQECGPWVQAGSYTPGARMAPNFPSTSVSAPWTRAGKRWSPASFVTSPSASGPKSWFRTWPPSSKPPTIPLSASP